MRIMMQTICCVLLLLAMGVPSAIAAKDDWHVEVEPDWRGYYRSESPVVARDFRRYMEALELDDEQMATARDLFTAFESEIRDISTLMREQRADSERTFEKNKKKQRKQQQARLRMTERYDKRAGELTTHLFSDLRLMLTSKQEEAWKELEQLRRRRETLSRFAAYPAENVDLVVIIEGLKMPEDVRSGLNNTLENYLVELDNAVMIRNAKVASLSGPARKIARMYREWWEAEDETDQQRVRRRIESRQEKLVSGATHLRDLCKRVKDINERYAQQIMIGLSSDLLPRFERQVAQVIEKSEDDDWGDYNRARRAMRAIVQLEYTKPIAELRMQAYGEDNDYYQRYAERMRAIPSATEKQVDAIKALKAEFETEYEALRKRHNRKMPRAKDPNQFEFQLDGAQLTLYQGERPQHYWERWEEEQPSEDFQRDNSKLSQRYMDRLRHILTLEQRSYIANY